MPRFAVSIPAMIHLVIDAPDTTAARAAGARIQDGFCDDSNSPLGRDLADPDPVDGVVVRPSPEFSTMTSDEVAATVVPLR